MRRRDDYLYGFALGDHGQHTRDDWAIRFGEDLSIDSLGLRTDLMWNRLTCFATDDASIPSTDTWEDQLAPPLFDRYPGDEEDFDDELDEEDEELDDEDFDDEDDLDDEDFDDEDDLDEDIDDELDEEIDDLDIDEDDDLDDEEDEEFDEDEDDEDLDNL